MLVKGDTILLSWPSSSSFQLQFPWSFLDCTDQVHSHSAVGTCQGIWARCRLGLSRYCRYHQSAPCWVQFHETSVQNFETLCKKPRNNRLDLANFLPYLVIIEFSLYYFLGILDVEVINWDKMYKNIANITLYFDKKIANKENFIKNFQFVIRNS